VRVPFADVDTFKIPDGISYEQALFLSDIFPTGFQAAEQCEIKEGETVAVWGCGPVGLFAIKSCFLLGARAVFAVDRLASRLEMARVAGAIALNYEQTDIIEALNELTGGCGPSHVIDCVGMEAHGTTPDAAYDNLAQRLRWETDRAHALREAIQCCGKGGTVSIPGVYTGIIDKFPLGIAFAKGLTFKMGQTHVQRYFDRLMQYIMDGRIDPTFLISHRASLTEAPEAYQTFSEKADDAIKFVLTP
jgi:threonine dehydrogenase-like Zn-dependent dehydrogenase